VPEKHRHRGPDPEDAELFASSSWPGLRQATNDLSWLLSRGYAIGSAGELVGNRYALARRQRIAIARCACSDAALARRRGTEIEDKALGGREIWLDGYNVLIGLEAALAGGVILRGRDGCFRDMATIYARYREVEETVPALSIIGRLTTERQVVGCRWFLDRPVSNSGRLRQRLLDVAATHGWNWQVELEFNPDRVLSECTEAVASSDSVILDRCQAWVNLAGAALRSYLPETRFVDLSLGGPC
jgi:hypothetical protein